MNPNMTDQDLDKFFTPYTDRQVTRSYAKASGTKLFFEEEEQNKTKKTKTSTKYNVPVGNKYESLSDSDNDDNTNSDLTKNIDSSTSTLGNPDDQHNATLLPATKPKPIIIKQYGEDLKKVGERAQAVCKKKVLLKYLGDKYSCRTENIDDFHSLKAFLTTNNIPHYTYTLGHEKDKTAVLKGLPPTYSTQEILDELQTTDDKISSCTLMATKNTKYPIYLVKFSGGAQFKDILKISSIFYIRVYWEKYQPRNKVTQCYNCQQYGHGARNCSLAPKCLKCGENHQSRDCKKPRDTPPHCANCPGEHLSNSKLCNAYLTYYNKINKNKGEKAEQRKIEDLERQLNNNDDNYPQLGQRTRHTSTPNNPTRPALTRRPNTNDENLNDFITLQQVLTEINQVYNIKHFLNKAQTVLTKLKQATKPQDKVAAMFELMADG